MEPKLHHQAKNWPAPLLAGCPAQSVQGQHGHSFPEVTSSCGCDKQLFISKGGSMSLSAVAEMWKYKIVLDEVCSSTVGLSPYPGAFHMCSKPGFQQQNKPSTPAFLQHSSCTGLRMSRAKKQNQNSFPSRSADNVCAKASSQNLEKSVFRLSVRLLEVSFNFPPNCSKQ